MPKIRLFLSSPGDVEAERQRVHKEIAQINRMWGDVYDVSLEVLDWKTHVTPDMGRAQEVINRQINDYDIFVGVMWKRFGTPTGEAESGTEEEFKSNIIIEYSLNALNLCSILAIKFFSFLKSCQPPS